MFIVSDMLHDFSVPNRVAPQKGHISAIIPVYEKKLSTLGNCLQAVLRQTYEKLEIIVVNNGARNVEQIVSRYGKHIRIENLDQNFGASYARNHGAVKSRGEYLWFIDSDIIDIQPDCAANMVHILSNNPGIGTVGGIIYQNSYGTTTVRIGFCTDHNFSEHPQRYTLYDDYYVNSGCIMVNRQVFDMVQGFTEYIEYLRDDNDFGYKIKAMGLRCVGDFRTVGLHTPRKSGFCPDMFMQKMAYKNSILYLAVNYKLREMADFLLFKFSRNKAEIPKIKAHPESSISAKLSNRLKKFYALTSVSLFLLIRIHHVISLRRKRQALLKTLRERNVDVSACPQAETIKGCHS